MIMIPDKYQRLHTLAHTDVLHRVYRNGIIDILAEVKRLREENKILATYMDIVQKYDEALSADGDTDPRWSELYD